MPTGLIRSSFQTLSVTTLQARLVWLVLSVVLPFAGLLVWYRIKDENEARQTVYKRMAAQAQARADSIRQVFDGHKALLERLATRPAVLTLDPNKCDPLLVDLPQVNPRLANLALRRADGSIICSHLEGVYPTLPPSLKVVLDEGLQAPGVWFSNAMIAIPSRGWLVTGLMPLAHRDGVAAAGLILSVDLLKLNELVFLNLPPEVTVGVFDRSETYVLRSRDPEKWIGQPIAPANRGKYSQRPTGQEVILAGDGVRRMYAWTTVPGLGWRVSAGVPEAQAMAPYLQARNRTLGAIAVFLCLAIYLAYRLAQSINRPVSQLAAITQRMAGGDLSARADVSGPSELRTLATQFNAMLDVRAQAIADLQNSETRWKFAIEGAGDGLWDWNVLDNTVYFSSCWKAMLGHDEDEVGNALTEWSSRVHPDDMAAVMADLQPHLDGTTTQYVNEHRVLCKDGSYKWVLDRGLVVARDAEGKPLRMVGTHSDITQRKIAQEALRRSDDQYRELLNVSPVPCALNDDALNITFVNRAFVNTFGYTLADIPTLEKWWPLAYPDPDYRARVCEEWQRRAEAVIAGGNTFEPMELRIRAKDGGVRTALVSAAGLSDRASRLHLVVLVDITERKAMEEQFRTNSDLLEYSQAATKVGGWELTLSTGQLYWTAETYRIHETDASEFNPTVDAGVSYFVPESRERITEALALAMNYGLGYALELQTYTTKGSLIDVYTTCSVSLKDGKPAKLTGIFQDITEQKAALRALQRSQQSLENVINFAMDAIISVDAQHKVILFNPAAEHMFGRSAASMLGQPLDCLMPSGLAAGHGSSIDDFSSSPAQSRAMGRSRNVKAVRANGEEFFIEPSISHMTVNGERIFTVMMRDVTEWKLAEEKIQKFNMELARSNADLEQFAYVASHDLQEPLRSVSSSVQLLKRRYEGVLDARANEFIDHAVGGVKRMQAVIDDLLAYSRVSSGPRVLKSADFEGALQVALQNLGRSITASQATITHDPLPTLRANPLQISQLFQNLIGNALKFRGDKPAVVHIGAVEQSAEWVFSVKDHGIGIAPEYFERVFKLFQRLHTRTEYEGTGIGLTICQKIVERHGGRIWVESEPEEGCTFFFSLPTQGVVA